MLKNLVKLFACIQCIIVVTFFGVSGFNFACAATPAFDNDGKTDITVWRPSSGIWYVYRSMDSQMTATHWGGSDDTPVPGDYDGDGKADVAVWRPSNGFWLIQRSSVGVFDYPYNPGDRSPIVRGRTG